MAFHHIRVAIVYLCALYRFAGDRLTDERVQCAQLAMSNGPTAMTRLQGFISKIEDWHRMMNFLEVHRYIQTITHIFWLTIRNIQIVIFAVE